MKRLAKALVVARIKENAKRKPHTFESRKAGPWDRKIKKADGGDIDKPAFDPSQSFQPVDAKPVFDPSKPFEPAPAASGLQSAVRGLGQGISFGFNDELRGIDEAGGAKPGEPGSLINTGVGLYKYFTGDKEAEKTYNEAVTREREKDESYKKAHPYLYGAGEVAGAIPAMAVLPEGEFANAGNFAKNLYKGGQLGAEYGALSGAGEGTDASSRGLGAVEGAVTGAAGGAGASVLGAGAGAVYDRFGKPIVNAVRGLSDPEGEAARRLSVALRADQDLISKGHADGMSPTEWIAARSKGEPVTLADLGSSNTQALLRSAANTSPEGRAMLEKVINDRFLGQSERVADTVRGLIPGGADAGQTAEDLVKAYDKGRKPLYKQAYEDGDKEIGGKQIDQLMGSPTFVDAMRRASISGKDRAITEGYGAMRQGATVENGIVKFTKGPNGVPTYPNLQYWDAVKRELDDMAGAAFRGGEKGRGSVISDMSNTLRGELDKQVPSYANARGFAAQFFGENNALEAGRNLAGKKLDPAVIQQAMSKMKPDEKKLFQEGYASDWANRVIGNISETRDVTKAMFNSPNERARAEAVFGRAGMDKIGARMTLETIMDGARKAMGNSTTARQLIEAGLAGGALGGYLEGDWKGALTGAGAGVGARKLLATEMASGARKLIGTVDATTAKNVAKLLTSNDPNDLAQGLRMATKNQKIADGLRSVANRVALAGQQNATVPYRGVNLGPLQGPLPAAGGQDKQQ